MEDHVTPANVPNSVYNWVKSRELGTFCSHPRKTPTEIELCIWKTRSYAKGKQKGVRPQCEAVFGLRYSQDGRLLAGACENGSIVFIDPVSRKLIKKRLEAHSDCCNTLSFIDERLLASTSDDETAAVWDIRNLKEKVFKLEGHTNWVKNVDYHKPSRCLITSAFDSTVLSWDLNNIDCGNKVEPKLLLRADQLIRMKLSPEGESMYLTSALWDVIAVHNLDVSKLFAEVGHITKKDPFTILTKREVLRHSTSLFYETQKKACKRRNHVDMYCCNPGSTHFEPGYCHSIEVGPQNNCIALGYSGDLEKIAAVHNTRRWYPFSEFGDATSPGIPPPNGIDFIPRGIPTNFMDSEPNTDGPYIKELSISPCGRIVACPFGYGTSLVTYDKNFSHYDKHMNERLTMPQENDGPERAPKRSRKSYGWSGSSDLKPVPGHRVKTCFGQTAAVLSTCFSPMGFQLATGCEGGEILIHDPVF